ncbi:hypothetical protein [Caballeronia sp. LZ032]|uniref:MarR family transcriptional regulator n=1 Tax=Caballeronia sp. LZ032 TaxID=3038565 RepID=UPI0028573880|nr:hypothetical protein [Caballeronia sp. LZ032]MDR5882146.1 hypothetical protein [Caballeronia sp. LZ032]
MSVSSVDSRPADSATPADSSDSSTSQPVQQDAPQPEKPDDKDTGVQADQSHAPSIPTQLSVDPPTDSTPAPDATASAPTPPAPEASKQDDTILRGATADELERLNETYDHDDKASWRNQDNAASARELNSINMTGRPDYAKAFQNQLPGLQAQIADMPDDALREQNLAQLSMFSTAFGNAADPGQRAIIVKQFESFRQAVSEEHDDTQADPVKHAESIFTAPFGSGYLDADGKRGIERLDNLRDNFESATTSAERETAMAQGTALKRVLQSKIADRIYDEVDAARLARQKTFGEVIKRLNEASGMTISGPGDDSPARLEHFGAILQDEQHALAFTELMKMSPEGFSKLREWEDRTRRRDANAEQAEQSHLFHRFELPPFSSISDVLKNPPLPNDDYGKNLVAGYQWAQRRLVAAEQRISVQGKTDLNPLRREYLTAYSPPPPEWLQELDEAFCRLTVGAMPVASLFTNSICPHTHLNDTARTFIDMGAGVLGTALGYKMPDVDFVGPAIKGGMSKAGALLDLLRKPKAVEIAAPGAAEVAQAASSAKAPPLSELDSASAQINGEQPLPPSYKYETPITQSTPGSAPGVMVDQQGQNFITMDGQPFAVKYDKDNGTWRVYDRNNPWRPSFPVRVNEEGVWKSHSDTGLVGGAPRLSAEEKKAILDDVRQHPYLTQREIALRNGVSSATVGSILQANDMEQRGLEQQWQARVNQLTPDVRSRITESLAAHPYQYAEIAQQFDTTPGVVKWLAKNAPENLSLKTTAEAIKTELADFPGLDHGELARRFDVTREEVDAIAALPVQSPAGGNMARPLNRTARMRPEVIQMVTNYLQAYPDASYSNIAAKLAVNAQAVSSIATEAGLTRAVPRVRISNATTEAIQRYIATHPAAGSNAVAREFGVSTYAVRKIQQRTLRRQDLQQAVATHPTIKHRVVQDLRTTSLTYVEIARKEGADVATVIKLAEAQGLNRAMAPAAEGAPPPEAAQGAPAAPPATEMAPPGLTEANQADIRSFMENWVRPEYIAQMLGLDENLVSRYVQNIAPNYATTGYFPVNPAPVERSAQWWQGSTSEQPGSSTPSTAPMLTRQDQETVQMLMGDSYQFPLQSIADWIQQPVETVRAYIQSVNPAYLQAHD